MFIRHGGHGHSLAAIWAGDFFAGESVLTLNVLFAARTGEFDVSHCQTDVWFVRLERLDDYDGAIILGWRIIGKLTNYRENLRCNRLGVKPGRFGQQ